MLYRGYEITVEIIGVYATGGSLQRIKRYSARVEFQTLAGASEEDICDKIDGVLGPFSKDPPYDPERR